MNPHKPKLVDEVSGIEVDNQRYLDYQEGTRDPNGISDWLIKVWKKQERERILQRVFDIISWGKYEELLNGTLVRDGHIMSEAWQTLLKEE